MTDLSRVRVKLDVSYYEARMIRSALIARAKKYEAQARKKTSNEISGLDMNVLGAETARKAADIVDAALTEGIAEIKALDSPTAKRQA